MQLHACSTPCSTPSHLHSTVLTSESFSPAEQVPAAQRTAADEQADKLDAMMELTLAHLQQRAEAGQGAGAWATLLAALDRALLPTQRSKFTQFLLFYAARQVAHLTTLCCAVLFTQVIIGTSLLHVRCELQDSKL